MAKRPKPVTYTPRHPSKYKGSYPIVLRSSWEVSFAQKCDLTPTILEWASEPVEIPYNNPLKPGPNKQSIYIPDFLIKFINKQGQIETKLIEIKPEKEALAEKAKNEYDAMSLMVNEAKWLAAAAWCKRRGIKFVTLTESGMFVNTTPTQVRKPKKPGKIKKVGKTPIKKAKPTMATMKAKAKTAAKKAAKIQKAKKVAKK